MPNTRTPEDQAKAVAQAFLDNLEKGLLQEAEVKVAFDIEAKKPDMGNIHAADKVEKAQATAKALWNIPETGKSPLHKHVRREIREAFIKAVDTVRTSPMGVPENLELAFEKDGPTLSKLAGLTEGQTRIAPVAARDEVRAGTPTAQPPGGTPDAREVRGLRDDPLNLTVAPHQQASGAEHGSPALSATTEQTQSMSEIEHRAALKKIAEGLKAIGVTDVKTSYESIEKAIARTEQEIQRNPETHRLGAYGVLGLDQRFNELKADFQHIPPSAFAVPQPRPAATAPPQATSPPATAQGQSTRSTSPRPLSDIAAEANRITHEISPAVPPLPDNMTPTPENMVKVNERIAELKLVVAAIESPNKARLSTAVFGLEIDISRTATAAGIPLAAPAVAPAASRPTADTVETPRLPRLVSDIAAEAQSIARSIDHDVTTVRVMEQTPDARARNVRTVRSLLQDLELVTRDEPFLHDRVVGLQNELTTVASAQPVVRPPQTTERAAPVVTSPVPPSHARPDFSDALPPQPGFAHPRTVRYADPTAQPTVGQQTSPDAVPTPVAAHTETTRPHPADVSAYDDMQVTPTEATAQQPPAPRTYAHTTPRSQSTENSQSSVSPVAAPHPVPDASSTFDDAQRDETRPVRASVQHPHTVPNTALPSPRAGRPPSQPQPSVTSTVAPSPAAAPLDDFDLSGFDDPAAPSLPPRTSTAESTVTPPPQSAATTPVHTGRAVPAPTSVPAPSLENLVNQVNWLTHAMVEHPDPANTLRLNELRAPGPQATVGEVNTLLNTLRVRIEMAATVLAPDAFDVPIVRRDFNHFVEQHADQRSVPLIAEPPAQPPRERLRQTPAVPTSREEIIHLEGSDTPQHPAQTPRPAPAAASPRPTPTTARTPDPVSVDLDLGSLPDLEAGLHPSVTPAPATMPTTTQPNHPPQQEQQKSERHSMPTTPALPRSTPTNPWEQIATDLDIAIVAADHPVPGGHSTTATQQAVQARLEEVQRGRLLTPQDLAVFYDRFEEIAHVAPTRPARSAPVTDERIARALGRMGEEHQPPAGWDESVLRTAAAEQAQQSSTSTPSARATEHPRPPSVRPASPAPTATPVGSAPQQAMSQDALYGFAVKEAEQYIKQYDGLVSRLTRPGEPQADVQAKAKARLKNIIDTRVGDLISEGAAPAQQEAHAAGVKMAETVIDFAIKGKRSAQEVSTMMNASLFQKEHLTSRNVAGLTRYTDELSQLPENQRIAILRRPAVLESGHFAEHGGASRAEGEIAPRAPTGQAVPPEAAAVPHPSIIAADSQPVNSTVIQAENELHGAFDKARRAAQNFQKQIDAFQARYNVTELDTNEYTELANRAKDKVFGTYQRPTASQDQRAWDLFEKSVADVIQRNAGVASTITPEQAMAKQIAAALDTARAGTSVPAPADEIPHGRGRTPAQPAAPAPRPAPDAEHAVVGRPPIHPPAAEPTHVVLVSSGHMGHAAAVTPSSVATPTGMQSATAQALARAQDFDGFVKTYQAVNSNRPLTSADYADIAGIVAEDTHVPPAAYGSEQAKANLIAEGLYRRAIVDAVTQGTTVEAALAKPIAETAGQTVDGYINAKAESFRRVFLTPPTTLPPRDGAPLAPDAEHAVSRAPIEAEGEPTVVGKPPVMPEVSGAKIAGVAATAAVGAFGVYMGLEAFLGDLRTLKAAQGGVETGVGALKLGADAAAVTVGAAAAARGLGVGAADGTLAAVSKLAGPAMVAVIAAQAIQDIVQGHPTEALKHTGAALAGWGCAVLAAEGLGGGPIGAVGGTVAAIGCAVGADKFLHMDMSSNPDPLGMYLKELVSKNTSLTPELRQITADNAFNNMKNELGFHQEQDWVLAGDSKKQSQVAPQYAKMYPLVEALYESAKSHHFMEIDPALVQKTYAALPDLMKERLAFSYAKKATELGGPDVNPAETYVKGAREAVRRFNDFAPLLERPELRHNNASILKHDMEKLFGVYQGHMLSLVKNDLIPVEDSKKAMAPAIALFKGLVKHADQALAHTEKNPELVTFDTHGAVSVMGGQTSFDRYRQKVAATTVAQAGSVPNAPAETPVAATPPLAPRYDIAALFGGASGKSDDQPPSSSAATPLAKADFGASAAKSGSQEVPNDLFREYAMGIADPKRTNKTGMIADVFTAFDALMKRQEQGGDTHDDPARAARQIRFGTEALFAQTAEDIKEARTHHRHGPDKKPAEIALRNMAAAAVQYGHAPDVAKVFRDGVEEITKNKDYTVLASAAAHALASEAKSLKHSHGDHTEKIAERTAASELISSGIPEGHRHAPVHHAEAVHRPGGLKRPHKDETEPPAIGKRTGVKKEPVPM